jgi:hypothetical protein
VNWQKVIFWALALFLLSACAVHKVENFAIRESMSEARPIFIHGEAANTYEASANIVVKDPGSHSLVFHDTLKFDTSGLVMDSPRKLDSMIIGQRLSVRDASALVTASLIRRYRHFHWSLNVGASPMDWELVSMSLDAGYSAMFSQLAMTVSVGWMQNHFHSQGVYHEKTPSHTDLEGVYARRVQEGMVWGNGWRTTGGLKYLTKWRGDPFASFSYQVKDYFPDDAPGFSDYAVSSMALVAGIATEPRPGILLDFFFGIDFFDYQLSGYRTGLLAGWRLPRKKIN